MLKIWSKKYEWIYVWVWIGASEESIPNRDNKKVDMEEKISKED